MSSNIFGVALAGAVVALSGCYVHAQPAPVGYAEVSSAPVAEVYVAPPADIEAQPSMVYEGRTVYFTGDRWYYRDGAHWTYYRQEPAGLYRQRGYVVQAHARRTYVAPRVNVAPPAARVEVRGQVRAEPARRESAPPAREVR